MMCPTFVTEMNAQLDQARQNLAAATAAPDDAARGAAEARLFDLAEVVRRGGVEVRHLTTAASTSGGSHLPD